MRVPVVVALSGGLLLSGLSCTAQARPTPSPSPAKVRTSSPSSSDPGSPGYYDNPEQANKAMSLTIIIPLLVTMALICVPAGLILFWLMSSDLNTIDKRQGK